MESPRRLHLKTLILIFIMVLAGPLGNVLLGKGMKHVGAVQLWPPAELPHVFIRVFTAGTIWLGVGSLLVFFAAYMIVLSWADYSYVQPASSISYVVVALLASAWLGEFVPPLRWAGIAVICIGVFLVGHTHPSTTENG
ncbi:MAG: EamA family transporter [Candidatus Korobacteraceae bacterium]|jgi:drug/metabolite transporter (DMT)-like permease